MKSLFFVFIGSLCLSLVAARSLSELQVDEGAAAGQRNFSIHVVSASLLTPAKAVLKLWMINTVRKLEVNFVWPIGTLNQNTFKYCLFSLFFHSPASCPSYSLKTLRTPGPPNDKWPKVLLQFGTIRTALHRHFSLHPLRWPLNFGMINLRKIKASIWRALSGEYFSRLLNWDWSLIQQLYRLPIKTIMWVQFWCITTTFTRTLEMQITWENDWSRHLTNYL